MSVAQIVSKLAEMFGEMRGNRMRVQEASTPMHGPERLPGGLTKPGANEERLLVAKAKSGGSGAFGELYE